MSVSLALYFNVILLFLAIGRLPPCALGCVDFKNFVSHCHDCTYHGVLGNGGGICRGSAQRRAGVGGAESANGVTVATQPYFNCLLYSAPFRLS